MKDTKNIFVKLDDVVNMLNQMKKISQQNLDHNKGKEYEKFFQGQVETLTTAAEIVQHSSFAHFENKVQTQEHWTLLPVAGWTWFNEYQPDELKNRKQPTYEGTDAENGTNNQ